jgi:dihydrofolate synthase/folylpolyglutamate synthase
VLGDTLAKIAAEKAGIIKPGCTVISHPQTEEADRVIRDACREKSVNLVRIGKDVTVKSLNHDLERQKLEVNGLLGSYAISIPLLGQYQLDNTAAAVAGIEVLIGKGVNIPRETLLKGLASVDFPGRMQIIHRKPFVVVDGGHNPGAAQRLKEAILEYFKPAKSMLVIGISSDKDIAGIVNELSPAFTRVIVTRANNPRSTSPELLAKEFARFGIEVQVTESVPHAMAEARAESGDYDLICATGSLFVVGEAIDFVNNHKS